MISNQMELQSVIPFRQIIIQCDISIIVLSLLWRQDRACVPRFLVVQIFSTCREYFLFVCGI